MKPLEYITNLFLRGIDADTDENLLVPDHSSIRQAYLMRRTINGTYKRAPGDVIHEDREEDATQYCTGLFSWVTENYVVEFWYNTSTYVKTIYVSGTKVAEHADIPGSRIGMIDAAIDEDDGIMYITDGQAAPVYYDLYDVINSFATQKYFTEYDAEAHRLQLVTHTNQPKFIGLEYVGAGSGLIGGGYTYAVRYTDPQGNATNWSPSTPVIPVHTEAVITTPGNTKNGVFTTGDEPGGLTNKGIRIRFRVTNEAGFAYMQIKRTAHNTGQSPDFSPNPEYLNLVADADGAAVDISSTVYDIIDFIDKDGLDWLPLDEASELESQAIKLCKTIRLTDGRLVIGGVEYEARDLSSLSDNAFIIDSESKRAQPVNMDLGFEGFSKTWNQVYRKNSTRGERFGYAIQCVDDLGGLTFAVPIPDLENYQMPNRRDAMTGVSEVLSNLYTDERPEYALYDSDDTDSWDRAYEVFSRVWQDTQPAGTSRSPAMLDVDGVSASFDSFQPLYPAGKGDNKDWGFRSDMPCDQMDDHTYNFHQSLNNHIWSLGWAFTGINTNLLPSWVRGFKIVRTPPANRVLAQGLATYVFAQQGSQSPAEKEGSKLTFYSPDIDPFYGNKAYLYDDIINNPDDYQLQLVSVLGFNSSAFSGSYEAPNCYSVDLLSYANIAYENYIYNGLDPLAKIGRGSGHVTFGRWRNYLGLAGSNMGAGITSRSPDYLFDISSVEKIDGGQYGNSDGRSHMLELTVDAAVYAQLDTMTKSTGNDNVNRVFHEPVYIVNIVHNNANILTTNTQSYQDTGVYQKLESIIGTAIGGSGQTYALVDERPEDVHAAKIAAADADVRYIMVNGQRWMDVTLEASGSITTWGAAINSGGGLGTGYFTLYGKNYYGMYTITASWINNGQATIFTVDPKNPVTIKFDVVATLNFYPPEGDEIKVVYNNNSPIIVFGGDSFVGEVFNAVVDNKVNGAKSMGQITDSIQADAPTEQLQINGPMPGYTYRISGVNNAVFIPRHAKEAPVSGGGVQARSMYDNERTPVSDIIPDDYNITVDNIRQWVFGFICESKSNTILAYGDTYPRRNYVQRPTSYPARNTDEEPKDYYLRAAVYSDYYDKFGDEYLLWERGGFVTPQMLNYDYTKDVSARAVNKPLAGYAERVKFWQRLAFSLDKNPAIQNSPSLRTFLPINYYDLKRADRGQITILYDAVSGQGRNLYAVTESGLALVLTNKTVMRGAVGEQVGLIDLEGKFIQDEIWLNTAVGCPSQLSRSKSEGVMETADGQFVQALSWVNNKGVMLFFNNDVRNIIANWRDRLYAVCKGLPHGTNYPTLLTVFNERENELWVEMAGNMYVFNFFLNNWTHELPHDYDRMIFKNKESATYNEWPYLLGARADRLYSVENGTYTLLSDSEENMDPYIDIVINPDLHTSWEFIDYLLHANATPKEMIFDTGASSPNTDTPPVVRDLNPGLYSYIGRRDSGAKDTKAMQGPYLTIRITFDGSLTTAYEVKAIRVGFNNIIE